MIDRYEDLRGSAESLQKECEVVFGLIICVRAM